MYLTKATGSNSDTHTEIRYTDTWDAQNMDILNSMPVQLRMDIQNARSVKLNPDVTETTTPTDFQTYTNILMPGANIQLYSIGQHADSINTETNILIPRESKIAEPGTHDAEHNIFSDDRGQAQPKHGCNATGIQKEDGSLTDTPTTIDEHHPDWTAAVAKALKENHTKRLVQIKGSGPVSRQVRTRSQGPPNI